MKQIRRMKICKKCPKTSIEFKNERSFYHHEKTHDDEKNEVCDDCEKLFRTKNDLSSHRHSVHNQKDEYKCNHCEWIFSTKSNLKKLLKKINNAMALKKNLMFLTTKSEQNAENRTNGRI